MKYAALLMLVSIALLAAPAAAQDWATAKRIVLEEAPRHAWATEAGMHAGAAAIVNRLACETKDDRWGRKSTNTGPISGDTIAYRLGGLTPDGRNTRMHVVDFCAGCGDVGAQIQTWAVDHGIIENQRFIAVAPDCGSGPPPTPDPDPDPNPPPDLAPLLLQLVAKLEAIEKALVAQSVALANQTEATAALRTGQAEQTEALRAAIAELRAQVAAGVKIRF